MPSSSEQLFELDGRKLTYDRYRYELAIRNQTTLEQVNNLALNEGRSVVSVAADFDQQEYGGFLRGVIPQLLDKYGNVNATAALSYYEQARRAWTEKQAYNSASRSSNRQRQQRYAAAVTQGSIRKASITGAEYVAVYADTYDKVAKTDAIVNYAMKVRAQSGHGPSVAAMENALTREVAAYHRDTVLFNSGLDKSVSRVQRVAQAKACEFCRLMALGSTNGTVRLTDYAIKFHSHCHCTIQTLFEGDAPIRPDYYDKFEAEYVKAKSEFNGTNADFKQTLENWRALNRGKTSPVAVSAPAARVIPAQRAPVVPTGPYSASMASSRTVSSQAPADKSGWWWTREHKATKSKRELIEAHNAEIIALRSKTLLTGTDRALARELALREVRENIKVLDKPELLLDSMEKTNPKYDMSKSAYSSNCARVISAYEMRRRGFDVTASKYVAQDASQANLIYARYWKHPETGRTLFDDLEDRGTKVDGEWTKRSYVGRTTYDDYLERLAADYPPGSRGVIQVAWANARAGHVFNFEVKANGSVILVDAQTGKMGSELARYFDRGVLWKSGRQDDKEPMAGILQYLEGGVSK